ncbi:hypothetical protein ACIRU3_31175 [Streptomyces sp. NPDC101151]|uniref:hypothetical protein n=1 Tax=Streptomyces sp. NPDC101151 TaxID=3366115 RepID=UPI0037FA7C97
MTNNLTCDKLARLFSFVHCRRLLTSRNPRLSWYQLSWSAADPAHHPFTWDEDEQARLTELIVPIVPTAETAEADGMAGYRFVDEATALLADRYGLWACGWHKSIGEGGGGGVVTSWCCVSHSVSEPRPTAERVVASLLEWRAWLEELAERFTRLAPPPDASPEDRSWHLERAATRLVTLVMDRTSTECAWYGMCAHVLTWFLSSAGLSPQEAARAVDEAIGGRFASWTSPAQTLVDSVAEDLAVGLTGERPYRDH